MTSPCDSTTPAYTDSTSQPGSTKNVPRLTFPFRSPTPTPPQPQPRPLHTRTKHLPRACPPLGYFPVICTQTTPLQDPHPSGIPFEDLARDIPLRPTLSARSLLKTTPRGPSPPGPLRGPGPVPTPFEFISLKHPKRPTPQDPLQDPPSHGLPSPPAWTRPSPVPSSGNAPRLFAVEIALRSGREFQ